MANAILVEQYHSRLRAAYVESNGFIKFALQQNHPFNLDDIFCGRVTKKDLTFFWVDIGKESPMVLPRERHHTFNEGDFIVVQIVRLPTVDRATPSGIKGARLSTNLHFIGKFCTFHPFKKNPPDQNISLREMGKSLPHNQLHLMAEEVEQFQSIYAACFNQKTIGLCWQAPSPIERLLRDAPADCEVIFDNENVAFEFKKQKEIFNNLNYKIANLKERPLFNFFGIEETWDEISQPYVPLPHHGGIYIEENACATTIDVNSGGYAQSAQNLNAAQIICRQIALRQLGGPIIIDFAGTSNATERNKIIQAMQENLKKWRIKDVKILGWSHLEYLELLRPRYADSLINQIQQIA